MTEYVLDTWRQHIEGYKKHSLLTHKSDAFAVGISNVTALLVECHLTILGDKFIHGHDGTVHAGVLKPEVEGVPIVLLMNDVDLPQIWSQVAGGRLVAEAPFLPLGLLDWMVRENLFAVCYGRL